jgi:exonuclease-1
VACAIELATGRPTTKYVDFAMSRVRMLLDFGVIPYLVFDGDAIPSKAGTNAERRKRREDSLAAGLELYRAGKVSQAHQELQKAAGVSPLMARQLIDELKRNNIQYVVAPYEADAQLAYLEQKGIINGVLSEDSDLLVFGVKRLLTKLNQYGECIEIERADFAHCKELSLAGWTDTMFRRMAILSGCDYLTNVPKMGLKTSYRYVRKYKDTERLLRMVALEGFLVPVGYLESFNNAELTFLHHRVFCPLEQRLVFLNELAPGTREEDMPFLGANVQSEIAIGVACGDLNPKTKDPLHARTAGATPRPALKDLRRQTLPASSELKPTKSIDTFFKPYRQPLAELDPNSLTPSPSAQRLLNQHRNASWEPRMVSSAPQLRRAGSTISGAQTPSHTDRSAFLAKAGRISTYQPPKRQRLCSESDNSPSKEVTQSPFFTSNEQHDEPSPLARKQVSKKKPKNRGFEIFSDSSISDEAVQYPTLEALDGNACQESPTKNNSPQAILQSSPVKPDEHLSSTPGPVRSFGTIITTAAEQATSQDAFAVDGVDEFEDLIEYHIREQNKKLKKTFVLQSPERRQSALASLASPTSPQSPTLKSPEASTFTAQSPEMQATALKSLSAFTYQALPSQPTPSQSLTRTQSQETKIELAKAAIIQRLPSTNVLAPARAPPSSLQRLGRNALAQKAPAMPLARQPAYAEHHVDVGNLITAEEDRPHVREAWASKGSEDWVVPDTDEESAPEDYVDAPEEMGGCRKLDLAAFTFTGK